MKTSDIGFAFDLVFTLAYIITVPLLLMFIFGSAITKGIQKMQDQRYGMTSSRIKPPRWQQFLKQKLHKKNVLDVNLSMVLKKNTILNAEPV